MHFDGDDGNSDGDKGVNRAYRPSIRAPSPDDFLSGGVLKDFGSIDNGPLAPVRRYLDALIRPLLIDDGATSGDLDLWITAVPMEIT